MDAPVKVACIQAEPVVLDREATIDKLAALAAEAAGNGAQLLVFPEAFVPAYPSSVWAKALAGWAEPGATEAFALLARESVAVPGRGRGADRRGGAGARRLDRHRRHRGRPRAALDALQHAALPRARTATLALKHRKLVPTNHERLVWGQGDGDGLRAIPTPLGRIGGLICWENYMPLARFALYESGVEIYIASTADDGDAWQSTLVHIARESRAFVVSPSHFQRASAYPDDFPLAAADRGRRHDRPRRLGDPRARTARTSPARSTTRRASSTPSSTRRVLWAERQRFDPAGHYHRPDVLGLRAHPARAVSSAAVVGAGVFGASIARELDRRGWDVTLVEQYAPGQRALGLGRRHAPPALLARRPGVVHAAAQRALELWRELEAETGLTALRAGRRRVVRHRRERLRRPERADARAPRHPLRAPRPRQEARRLYPSLGGDDLRSVLFEPERRRAQRPRRRPRRSPPASASRPGRPTPADPPRADVVVWACGVLAAEALPRPRRAADLPPRRLLLRRRRRAGPGRPGSASTTARTTATATSAGSGMKISPDGRGAEIDPDELERAPRPGDGGARPRVRGPPLPRARRRADRRLARLPVRPHRRTRTSSSTATPSTRSWWLVGGGSGHGFKHGPTLGEYVADCVEGRREPEPFHALGPRSGHAGLRTADIEA